MKNLKILRKDKDLTQQDMANILNVSRVTYSRYELGIRKPDYDTLIKLSKFFDVSTDFLLDLIEVPLKTKDVEFMHKIHETDDPEKIADEFDVTIDGRVVTGKELLELLKTLKELDQAVHGDFFSKKDKKK